MILLTKYGVVNGLFISNCIGKEAIAGFNLIWQTIMILGSVRFMFVTGVSAFSKYSKILVLNTLTFDN